MLPYICLICVCHYCPWSQHASNVKRVLHLSFLHFLLLDIVIMGAECEARLLTWAQSISSRLCHEPEIFFFFLKEPDGSNKWYVNTLYFMCLQCPEELPESEQHKWMVSLYYFQYVVSLPELRPEKWMQSS